MKVLYKDPSHEVLNVVQTSDTVLQGNQLTAKDVGVGFLVHPTDNIREYYIDYRMLNQMYIMMQRRQAADHAAANCDPAVCPVCAKHYPDIVKETQ